MNALTASASHSPSQCCAYRCKSAPAATRPSSSPTSHSFGKVITRLPSLLLSYIRAAVTCLAAMSDFVQFVRVTVPIASWTATTVAGIRGQAQRLLPLVVPSRRNVCSVCGHVPNALPMVRTLAFLPATSLCLFPLPCAPAAPNSTPLQLSNCDHVYCYGCAAQVCNLLPSICLLSAAVLSSSIALAPLGTRPFIDTRPFRSTSNLPQAHRAACVANSLYRSATSTIPRHDDQRLQRARVRS